MSKLFEMNRMEMKRKILKKKKQVGKTQVFYIKNYNKSNLSLSLFTRKKWQDEKNLYLYSFLYKKKK